MKVLAVGSGIIIAAALVCALAVPAAAEVLVPEPVPGAEAEILETEGIPASASPGARELCAECLTVPLPLSPADGETVDSLAPLLSWDAQTDPEATGTSLVLARNYAFTDYVCSAATGYRSGIGTWRYTSNLDPASTYYWRVRLRCGVDYSPYSEIFSFTTGSGGEILPAPEIVSPAAGSAICLASGTVTAEWAPVTGALDYIVVRRAAGGSSSFAYVTSNTTRVFTGLKIDTTYRWTVKGRNDYGYGAESPLAAFRQPLNVSAGDYNGDGTADVAVFRGAQSLWLVRGLTQIYFGTDADIPVPGDYDGDGTADPAVWRSSASLWAVRGQTRLYHGNVSDLPVPGDYNGDGSCDPAVFRGESGRWLVRGVTKPYFGIAGDTPVSADLNGDGTDEMAVFRGGSGLWRWRGITRFYFGASGDRPVLLAPGLIPGVSAAVFRENLGLWVSRSGSRWYYGDDGDIPVPAAYLGENSGDYAAVFRRSNGLWAIRNTTKYWFGESADLPVTR